MGIRYGKYVGIFFLDFKMVFFWIFFIKIMCYFFCFVGNCDISDDCSYMLLELEVVVRDFVGKEKFQVELDLELLNLRFCIKWNCVRVLKKIWGLNVIDVGCQNRKLFFIMFWGMIVIVIVLEF